MMDWIKRSSNLPKTEEWGQKMLLQAQVRKLGKTL
jgi:hypothetical protein